MSTHEAGKPMTVWTTRGALQLLRRGRSGTMWAHNVGGAAPIRCILTPVGDGLAPGDRCKASKEGVVRVVGPSANQPDRYTVVQNELGSCFSLPTTSLTKIDPPEERTELTEARTMLEKMLDTYTNGGTGTYRQELVRECEAVLARLRSGGEP